jgi:hypothetical protein
MSLNSTLGGESQFWLANHNDWSRWFAISSLPAICRVLLELRRLACYTTKKFYLLKHIFLFKKTSIDLSLVACLVSFPLPSTQAHSYLFLWTFLSHTVRLCNMLGVSYSWTALFWAFPRLDRIAVGWHFQLKCESMVESTCLTCESTVEKPPSQTGPGKTR